MKNALGIPFTHTHCGDLNGVCHFCGKVLQPPETSLCPRTLQPVSYIENDPLPYSSYIVNLIHRRETSTQHFKELP